MISRERLVILTLVVTALAPMACASRGSAPAAPPSSPAPAAVEPSSAAPTAPPRASLADRLAPIFTAAPVAHAQLGVLVRSLATGDTLYALNEQRMMVPASNMKVLTVAAAARALGWDHRFVTRIVATGPLLPNGTLDGNLVVVGSGDPTINPRHPERWGALDDWAAALRARGIKVVSGHLIGDDNAFSEPGWGSGWSWDDLSAGYGAQIGALQYHENQVEIAVGPGLEPGARAIVSVSPAGHGLLVENRANTVGSEVPTRVSIERRPGETLLTINGQIATGAAPRTLLASVDNPTRLFVEAFREALNRKGIFVAGSALDVDELPSPPDLAGADTLIADQSPPLSAIIDPLLRHSRNEYAETLLWALSPADAPASEAAGLGGLRDVLTELGVDASLYRAFDGSGLSRYDMVTPESLVRTLTAVWNDPVLRDPFRAALPVTGQPGTLERNLKGTPGEGRVWAKTGSMFNIRALSGYATTVDGEPIVFAFIANNYTVPSAAIESMMDDALLAIVTERR
ncbi:MAG: D-alanyl-D-alanine carboxypeptidase/D-alanyl-D-alanine-endopeptidase [Acidobacteria bacterium]|nr:D-alanyl-D-alanine carboxypeptidase/D-alanyl-D-alanine-endopeptidase [Acidobacteriota bacterium]